MSDLRIGTSGWAYPSWKPDFYPQKTPASKFLNFYATRLNCVEVNYTFRARPKQKTLESWCEATPPDFSFAVKAHQRITHIKRLKDANAEIADFYNSLQPLSVKGKLGPVLFQLPPFLKADEQRLREFLKCIPGDSLAAIEYRNESWFTETVFDLMRQRNVALCIAESDDLQTPEVQCARDHACYRLRRTGGYSAEEIEQLAGKFSSLAEERDVYIYFKHEDDPTGALNAVAFLKACAARAGKR